MAPLIAILNALRRAIQRDLGAFSSIKVNNLFLFVALLMWGAFSSGQEPKSAEPFLLLFGLLLLFPLSADPLHKIPQSRLSLWPLSGKQRFALRIASTALSPIVWLAVLLVVFAARPAAAGLLIAAALLARGLTFTGGRIVHAIKTPWRLPQARGSFSVLVHNNLRQMSTILDFYAAILLSAGGIAYSLFSAHPDPNAFPILAMLVALALSTYAQCVFELDNGAGLTRYRLLALPGWRILLSKDIAFLGILLILVTPLQPGSGLTFGLAALAIGRYPSLRRRVFSPLAFPPRWRFMSGELWFSVPQILAGAMLGFAEAQRGAQYLLIAAALYCISLWGGGWYWDRFLRNAAD